MQTITVPLGERSYPIHIERGLLAKTGAMIREKLGDIAIAVVSDDHVAPLYMEEVVSSMEKVGLRVCSIVLPHGEQTKCLKSLETLYAFLCEHHLTRKDAIVALGGGVIGDLAGLAAATYLRGVHFVQLPTTLLAQVDSSVGGKVAVDLPQGKNLVGAFYQPELVLVDPDSLRTLTDDFWRDGLGEVVKYGCIGDEALFRLLEGIRRRRTGTASVSSIRRLPQTVSGYGVQRADTWRNARRRLNAPLYCGAGRARHRAAHDAQLWAYHRPRGRNLPALHRDAPRRGGCAGDARYYRDDGREGHDGAGDERAAESPAGCAGNAPSASGDSRKGLAERHDTGQEVRRETAACDYAGQNRRVPHCTDGC